MREKEECQRTWWERDKEICSSGAKRGVSLDLRARRERAALRSRDYQRALGEPEPKAVAAREEGIVYNKHGARRRAVCARIAECAKRQPLRARRLNVFMRRARLSRRRRPMLEQFTVRSRRSLARCLAVRSKELGRAHHTDTPAKHAR